MSLEQGAQDGMDVDYVPLPCLTDWAYGDIVTSATDIPIDCQGLKVMPQETLHKIMVEELKTLHNYFVYFPPGSKRGS